MLTDKEIRNIIVQGPESTFVFIKELIHKTDQLEKRIQALEAIINKNSQNSSKPPSSDIFRNNQNNSREKSNKQTGGQRGHKPHNLKMSDKPDEVIVHKADKCHNCLRSLKALPVVDIQRRQVFEIPPVKLKVTEHRSEVKKCPYCNTITKGEFPQEVSRKVQYGSGVYTFIAACQTMLMLSYERTCEFFEHMFDHTISQGTIKNINERLYNNLEMTELKIKESILASRVINQDETGIYIGGKRWWMHSSSTKECTFYQRHENRGRKAMDYIGIIPEFHGILVHDYWKPHLLYSNCTHYLCNAHILRELRHVFEEYLKQHWALEMKEL